MKKLTYLLFLAMGITSCSVESIDSTENLLTADAKTSVSNVEKVKKPEVICAGEVAEFSIEAPVGTNLQVQQWDGAEWVQVYQISQSSSSPQKFNLLFNEAKSYDLRVKIGNSWFATSVNVMDCSTCDNSFVAELVCGDMNTFTVTFTAEESGPIVIQGGLSNGTTILSKTSVGLTENTNHSGPSNSNANVSRWEGDIDACEEVSLTITFTGKNSIGDWSAKRGEVILGSSEEQSCN